MRRTGGIMLAVAACTMAGAAQAAAQEPVTPTDSAQHALRATLRMLNTVQEIHYSRTNAYSQDVAALQPLRPGWQIPEGVHVTIVFASPRGHGAVATHPLLPGQSCVMWIGDPSVAPELVTAEKRYNGVARPGRATCDFDPLPQQPDTTRNHTTTER